jgi:hypothetical protein
MRRCQWCKDGIAMVDPSGAAYIECALIPPAAVTVQRVEKVTTNGVEKAELFTDLKWVRPTMTLLGWCGQFKPSLWKMLFSRGPRT